MNYKLIAFKDKFPVIDESVFIADGTIIIGDVKVGKNSSIWYNCVLRGDVAPIVIGEGTNIQDGSIIHTSRFNGPAIIGNSVTIGHMVLLHACTVKDEAFIGMRSVIMDFAKIQERAFVAAGALISPHKIVSSYELWSGIPARFTRSLNTMDLKSMIDNTNSYVELAKNYKLR